MDTRQMYSNKRNIYCLFDGIIDAPNIPDAIEEADNGSEELKSYWDALHTHNIVNERKAFDKCLKTAEGMVSAKSEDVKLWGNYVIVFLNIYYTNPKSGCPKKMKSFLTKYKKLFR